MFVGHWGRINNMAPGFLFAILGNLYWWRNIARTWHMLTDWMTDWLVNQLIDWWIDLLIVSLIDWLLGWLIDLIRVCTCVWTGDTGYGELLAAAQAYHWGESFGCLPVIEYFFTFFKVNFFLVHILNRHMWQFTALAILWYIPARILIW